MTAEPRPYPDPAPCVIHPDRPHECQHQGHDERHGTVYRVHSAARGHTILATTNRGDAIGRAHALNQAAGTSGTPDDWQVQAATPRWETT